MEVRSELLLWPVRDVPGMTPPPDPVAALEAAHHVDDMGLFDGEVTLAALTDAGWSLSHDSERRSAVIGSERSDNEALVTLLGLPWHADAPVPGVATITFDFQGDRHALARFVNMLTDARAAIEGRGSDDDWGPSKESFG